MPPHKKRAPAGTGGRGELGLHGRLGRGRSLPLSFQGRSLWKGPCRGNSTILSGNAPLAGLLNALAGVPATRAALHQASEELKARLKSSAGRDVTAHASLQTPRNSA